MASSDGETRIAIPGSQSAVAMGQQHIGNQFTAHVVIIDDKNIRGHSPPSILLDIFLF